MARVLLGAPRVTGIRYRVQHLTEATRRHFRGAVAALATGLGTLGAWGAYRRREIAVIALLSASVLGGFAVEHWRGRAPTTLERLETEPPRLGEAARAPAPRSAPVRRAPCAERPRDLAHATGGAPARAPAPTPEAPLDLNRATAADLTRLPGIGPRLAARIVARRDALGGQFGSPDDLATVPGLSRRTAQAVTALVRVAPIGREPEALGDPPETPAAPP